MKRWIIWVLTTLFLISAYASRFPKDDPRFDQPVNLTLVTEQATDELTKVALPLDIVLESLAKSVGLKPFIYHIYGTLNSASKNEGENKNAKSGENKGGKAGIKHEPDWPLVKIDFNGKPFREVWDLLFDTYGVKFGIDYIYMPPDLVIVAPIDSLRAFRTKRESKGNLILRHYKIEAPPHTYLETKKEKVGATEIHTATVNLEGAKTWFEKEFVPYLKSEIGPFSSNWLIYQDQDEKVFQTPQGAVAINPVVILFSVYGTQEQQNKIKEYLSASGINLKQVIYSPKKKQLSRRFYQVTYLDPEKTVGVLKREYPDAVISYIPGQKILIVHATERTHKEILNFLTKIDVPPVEGPPIHQRTFKLSNARAIDVVAILTNLLGTPEKKIVSETVKQDQSTENQAVVKEQQVIAVKEDENKKYPKFAADPRTNSIIAIGTAEDLEKIASIIQKLDVKNKQIKLAIRIQSIDSSISRNLGFNWQSLSGGNLLMSVVDGALNLIFDSTRSLAALNITATLDALEEQNLSHKLSDVTIIAEDNLGYNENYTVNLSGNQEDTGGGGSQNTNANQVKAPAPAKIRAGGQIIIPVGETLQQYEYGLTLTIRPHISADGQIVLDLTSNMGSTPINGPQGSILIPENSFHTRLRVKNKETIVLSGIIRDEKLKTYRKVPLLGDIPLIGPLFSSRSSTFSHSELLIVITPEILDDTK